MATEKADGSEKPKTSQQYISARLDIEHAPGCEDYPEVFLIATATGIPGIGVTCGCSAARIVDAIEC